VANKKKMQGRGGRGDALVIRVGTRGSPLALAQTKETISLLRERADPRYEFHVEVIKTTGDNRREETLSSEEPAQRVAQPSKAEYTDRIEEALLEERIDLAVHSLKDLAIDLPKGLVIGCVPNRGDPRDVLVSKEKGVNLDQLRKGARIGTSSPRRKAQLLAYREDFEIVEIHGNVGTRVKKLWEEKQGECLDALVLASAGLKRLGLYSENVTQVIPTEVMIPAIGQGALALEIREDDSQMLQIVQRIHDFKSWVAVRAERAFSKELGGGCHLPIAAYATVDGNKATLSGAIATLDGRKLVKESAVGPVSNPEGLGRGLARKLMKKEDVEEILQKAAGSAPIS
jgi:hydroxymethylbilane synthase